MNRGSFLRALGIGGLSAVPGAKKLIEPDEPEVVEKIVERVVVQDKILEWNGPGSVYYHPNHGYVKIEKVEE